MKIFYVILISVIVTTNYAHSKSNTALITSGGVSLGIYEAGFLYYAIKEAKKRQKVNSVVASGASAGAINSFISIMEACSHSAPIPSKSLFWKTWLKLNIDKFKLKKGEKSLSLLSRSSMDEVFQILREKWNQGINKNCSGYLGVTVTRKQPLHFLSKKTLNFPRVREFFTVKITGRGKGLPPKIENFNLNDGSIQAHLPFSTDHKSNFEILRNVLLASSSFPIAFEHTELEHCLVKLNQNAKCSSANSQKSLFIDGGVYNNAPIDIAYRISKALKKDKQTQFVVIDPGVKDYPTDSKDSVKSIEPGIIQDSFVFLENFVKSSRTGQVSQFLSNHPELENQIDAIKVSLPLASEPLYGFLGFFEQDFRIFDFNLGILDAMNAVQGDKPHKKINKNEFNLLHYEWKVPACLIAAFNNNFEVLAECKKIKTKESENFAALLKVSIERLFNQCQTFKDDKTYKNPLCQSAKKGQAPDSFFQEHDEGWKQEPEEPEVSYFLRVSAPSTVFDRNFSFS